MLIINRNEKFVTLLGRSALCLLFSDWKSAFEGSHKRDGATIKAVADVVEEVSTHF